MRLATRLVVTASVVVAGACHRVVALQQPLSYIAANNPKVVWITQADGSEFAVQQPQVVQDSLMGYVGSQFRSVELHDAASVRVRQNAGARTAALIGVGVLGLAGFVYLVNGHQHATFNYSCLEDPDATGGCMTMRRN